MQFYYVSKKFSQFLYNDHLYKNGQDFLNTQYYLEKSWCFSGTRKLTTLALPRWVYLYS